jgi:hypothetical protein
VANRKAKMKTIEQTVQIYKPENRKELFPPEVKLTDRSKIDISLVDGSMEDARWVICTLLTLLGEVNPNPHANN